MAVNEDLEPKLLKLVDSAASSEPPSFKELMENDNPDWPSDAIFFVLYCWLWLGLRKSMSAMKLLEDAGKFDGKFRLSQLFEVLGLETALDDEIVETLRNRFSSS